MTLLTRRQVDGLDALHTAAFGCLTGGALLLPVALVFGMAIPLRVEPLVAALSVLLEPLTATLLAMSFFGDRLGVLGWWAPRCWRRLSR
ncbi:MAG: hypothetical protein GEU86_13760 [Actinophytocola sp.]|nr:hypothetical protein [Actinophytocola sp.]